MVSTRGNPVADGRKSTLPSRESRRSTRGALQEPEDELFWDSDDQGSRVQKRTKRVNVTFKDTTSPRSASSRSPGSPKEDAVMKAKGGSSSQQLGAIRLKPSEESNKAALRKLRTRTLAVLLSRSLADKKLKTWARKRPPCFSCEEAPRPQPSRDTPRVRSSRRRRDELAAIEGDTDTDDEIFSRTQTRRTRGERRKEKSPIKKEFVMNGDDIEERNSHMEVGEGLRRSSRRSNFSNQSWLVGSKKLRGYPTMVASSEPENEEPRPSRKQRTYIDSEGDNEDEGTRGRSRFHSGNIEPRRKRLRKYTETSEQEFCSLGPRTRQPNRRLRVPKSDPSDDETDLSRSRRSHPLRRYREDNSEEETGRKMLTRHAAQVKPASEEEEEEEEEMADEETKEDEGVDGKCTEGSDKVKVRYKEGKGEEAANGEDDEEGKNQEEEEEEEDDDDESDKYSDILEESESEEEEEEIKEKPGTLGVIKKKEMMEAAKKELPYTFEVPQDYEAFWALLENHSPGEVNTILERMVACNHPKLGGKNKEKCDYLCAYLLQTLNVLADYDGASPMDSVSPLMYVDCITRHIYGLTQFTPVNAANALKQVLLEKYGDCSKYKFKRYPMGDTFVFLKIAGMLFPSSDFIHPVMTPVMAFLCHLLGQGKISNRREVNAALFTAYLAYEYISRSKRFMPELTNVLNGLLFMSVPMKNKTKLPITPPFKCIGPTASLLVPEAPVKIFESSKLTFASINKKDEEMTDDFKMNVLQKTVELLQEVCKCWSGLASVRAIMRPTTILLDCLVLENLPKSVQEAIEALRQAIRSLPAQGKPLVKEDAKPRSIPMFEPAFEKIVEGAKKRHGSKEKLEHQKLLHNLKRERKAVKREIEKDTAYLARQKLQEQLESDAERKRKVGQIMGGLQMQESEHKKMKLKKK